MHTKQESGSQQQEQQKASMQAVNTAAQGKTISLQAAATARKRRGQGESKYSYKTYLSNYDV